jgi:selenocysteine lyase/cysteine desulfurase
MEETVAKYKNRKRLIGSFTACSNVTGIETPYHKMAAIMHKYNGLCFIDFAASAPYVDIDMHPADPKQSLDAIFFSPHKFLGGPGSSGVLVFNSQLYTLHSPDQPGGGTVEWTNAWGEYRYSADIEAREDGGTPGFLQAIRTALAIKVKEEMGTANIRKREHELLEIAFAEMEKVPGLHILADEIKERIGAISFYLDNIHYNLVVKLLNDRFGVQVRGGCACAGTYGHYLLDVSYEDSKKITDLIDRGDLSQKPGWIRLSIHPTMTNQEIYLISDALLQIQQKANEWKKDYIHNIKTNEFEHINASEKDKYQIHQWFNFH